jgi:DNA-binding response OmpR family regulator
MTASVLIIDDDPALLKLLAYEARFAGFNTYTAGTIAEGLEQLRRQPVEVVLTDVHLPDGNGIDLVRTIKTAYANIEVIAITSDGRISDGVRAIKNGAYDYLEKGADANRLVTLLNGAAKNAQLQSNIEKLDQQVNDETVKDKPDIISINNAQLERAAEIIKAIHSPLRQRILQLIFKHGKRTVTEIYTELELPQPIASQHLGILKNAGLVTDKREGKGVAYSANYTGIEKIVAFAQQLMDGEANEEKN